MQPRDLSSHDAYVAGRGIEEVARELGRDPSEFVKLASNENPHGPSPLAVERIHEVADGISAYPKAAHTDLRAAIAGGWDVDPAQVWLANGADGAIDCLCRATLDPGQRVLVPEPGFAYYPMSARYHHGAVATYSLSPPDFADTVESVLASYEGERVVFLTSPHNPTGQSLSLSAIERVAEETDEETLVVVDEAYGEFAPRPSAVSRIGGRARHVEGLHDPPEFGDGPGDGTDPVPGDAGPVSGAADPISEGDAAATGDPGRDDVAVLRTFSKAYGLAGLRLGYAVVPAAWADAYARVTTPFSAGELACRAGLAALEDADHVRRTVETAVWARRRMREAIDAPVLASHANFVLVEVGDAQGVATAMQRRGVIVRDCTSFGLPEYVRISCGTEAETERAIEATNAVLEADR